MHPERTPVQRKHTRAADTHGGRDAHHNSKSQTKLHAPRTPACAQVNHRVSHTPHQALGTHISSHARIRTRIATQPAHLRIHQHERTKRVRGRQKDCWQASPKPRARSALTDEPRARTPQRMSRRSSNTQAKLRAPRTPACAQGQPDCQPHAAPSAWHSHLFPRLRSHTLSYTASASTHKQARKDQARARKTNRLLPGHPQATRK